VLLLLLRAAPAGGAGFTELAGYVLLLLCLPECSLLLLLLLLLLVAPAGGAGFTELAGYIFGGNSEQESMEMTTPGGLVAAFGLSMLHCALHCCFRCKYTQQGARELPACVLHAPVMSRISCLKAVQRNNS
jgi:hypothetical protein